MYFNSQALRNFVSSRTVDGGVVQAVYELVAERQDGQLEGCQEVESDDWRLHIGDYERPDERIVFVQFDLQLLGAVGFNRVIPGSCQGKLQVLLDLSESGHRSWHYGDLRAGIDQKFCSGDCVLAVQQSAGGRRVLY